MADESGAFDKFVRQLHEEVTKAREGGRLATTKFHFALMADRSAHYDTLGGSPKPVDDTTNYETFHQVLPLPIMEMAVERGWHLVTFVIDRARRKIPHQVLLRHLIGQYAEQPSEVLLEGEPEQIARKFKQFAERFHSGTFVIHDVEVNTSYLNRFRTRFRVRQADVCSDEIIKQTLVQEFHLPGENVYVTSMGNVTGNIGSPLRSAAPVDDYDDDEKGRGSEDEKNEYRVRLTELEAFRKSETKSRNLILRLRNPCPIKNKKPYRQRKQEYGREFSIVTRTGRKLTLTVSPLDTYAELFRKIREAISADPLMNTIFKRKCINFNTGSCKMFREAVVDPDGFVGEIFPPEGLRDPEINIMLGGGRRRRKSRRRSKKRKIRSKKKSRRGLR